MTAREFVLPQIGKGPETVEIVEWHVSANERVEAGQVIASLDANDIVVDVAAPCAGRIGLLCGEEGDYVTVGQMLVIFSEAESDDGADELLLLDDPVDESADDRAEQGSVPSAPGAAELARDLRLELESITTEDSSGVVTVADVERAVETPRPASNDWLPLEGARKAMSARISLAARDSVVATLTARVDVGHWEQDSNLTLRLARALSEACLAVPALNASYDSTRDAICLNDRVNIGLVADVPDGHIVTVINNAAALNDDELIGAADQLISATRERALDPEQLRGATITLAELGNAGVEFAQLPLAPPQVAALAAGQIRPEAVVRDDEVCASKVLPLSLGFDHRVVSLHEAGAFLAACCESLGS